MSYHQYHLATTIHVLSPIPFIVPYNDTMRVRQLMNLSKQHNVNTCLLFTPFSSRHTIYRPPRPFSKKAQSIDSNKQAWTYMTSNRFGTFELTNVSQSTDISYWKWWTSQKCSSVFCSGSACIVDDTAPHGTGRGDPEPAEEPRGPC